MFSFIPGLGGRPTTAWFNAGPSSSFPDIDPESDSADLSQPRGSLLPRNEESALLRTGVEGQATGPLKTETAAAPPSKSSTSSNSTGISSQPTQTPSPNTTGLQSQAVSSILPCKTPNPRNLGCRVFHISREDGARGREVQVQTGALEFDDDDDADDNGEEKGKMEDEVLVFRFRGRIHATDHKCPHALFPLSKALPFDIEDFGVVLSAGLQCPKHGWSFDMFTGVSDRAAYKLNVWEVKEERGEVWVRRRVRMG